MSRSKPNKHEPIKTPDEELTPDQTSQNIEAILSFYEREEKKISGSQRILERVSEFIGRPIFLGIVVIFVVLWILANFLTSKLGYVEFDPAPFFWLQGLVTLGTLLMSSIVLIKQNRSAKMDEIRAHLDLKVTLLTEQKAAKMIDLLEELRRDLPNVKDREDNHASALTQAMNPNLVTATLEEIGQQETRIHPVQD